MKNIGFIFILLGSLHTFAQIQIQGVVKDDLGMPIEGANVYLHQTYDGASTDENGHFSFETSENDEQTLLVSFVSFDIYSKTANVSDLQDNKVILYPSTNTIEAVELSSGSNLRASASKAAIMTDLDVVTTAGATGDFVGALQTLPGVQKVGEDGRLFIRGGSADESAIFIDGLKVFKPYLTTSSNVPTRSRYSPFLFRGISLNTGGYPVEYGGALSGILELETKQMPARSETHFSLMSVGGGLTHLEKKDKASYFVGLNYINLKPYTEVFHTRNDWEKPYRTIGAEGNYQYEFEEGLLKMYGAFSDSNFVIFQEDINFEDKIRLKNNDRDVYVNSSYHGRMNSNLKLKTGISLSYNENKSEIDLNKANEKFYGLYARFELNQRISNVFQMNYGLVYENTFNKDQFNDKERDLKLQEAAVFAASKIHFTPKFGGVFGMRATYQDFQNKMVFSPQVGLAYQINKQTTLNADFGQYHQQTDYRNLTRNQDLQEQQATHYIAGYRWQKSNRNVILNVYRKDYQDLIKYKVNQNQEKYDFSNNGNGYAQGVDVFWRDNKSIKSLQYWLSYSYIDSKRDYQNDPYEVQPDFITNHQMSLVSKYWWNALRSQVGMSYTYGSGRSYENPNETAYLASKTKDYHNVSLNWSYLITQQKIIHVSVTNVFGFQNVFGYNYTDQPNLNGVFERQAILPSQDTGFFIGFFWTLSSNKSINQLDTL